MAATRSSLLSPDHLTLGAQFDEVGGLALAIALALVLGFVVDVLTRVVGDAS